MPSSTKLSRPSIRSMPTDGEPDMQYLEDALEYIIPTSSIDVRVHDEVLSEMKM